MVTPPESIIYEDEDVQVCLASFPLATGHTIVFWKKPAPDLHVLSRGEYELLMRWVDRVRDALLIVFDVQKVYTVYLDELNQVHWHLIPAHNHEGFTLFSVTPNQIFSFEKVAEIQNQLKRMLA